MGKQTQKLDENYPAAELIPETGKYLGGLDSEDRAAVVLTQRQVNELSGILGRNVLHPNDLILACQRLTTCNVEGVQIPIEPGVLIRLKSRAHRQEFPEFLKQMITKSLHDYVGW